MRLIDVFFATGAYLLTWISPFLYFLIKQNGIKIGRIMMETDEENLQENLPQLIAALCKAQSDFKPLKKNKEVK
jgi:hypothetical protein